MNELNGMTDGYGRKVSYLRLSVTDRCNLRCLYCSAPDMRFIPHDNILRYEELIQLVDLARSLGIGKVRLTGGEPMARRNFLFLVESLMARHPDLDLRLTTNGVLLPGKAALLKELGVGAINISLDAMNPETFARITGRDEFNAVRKAIDEVLAQGPRLKINAVGLKGVNDGELKHFLNLAMEHPVDVRFIEFMPMGGETVWSPERYWSADQILADAARLVELSPVASGERDGPARMFRLTGGKGRFGVISPMSNHFCDSCNRLRITPDGRLRTCLFSDREYRLRPLLRNPKLGLEAARKVVFAALARKPRGYELLKLRQAQGPAAQKRMSAIGG